MLMCAILRTVRKHTTNCPAALRFRGPVKLFAEHHTSRCSWRTRISLFAQSIIWLVLAVRGNAVQTVCVCVSELLIFYGKLVIIQRVPLFGRQMSVSLCCISNDRMCACARELVPADIANDNNSITRSAHRADAHLIAII